MIFVRGTVQLKSNQSFTCHLIISTFLKLKKFKFPYLTIQQFYALVTPATFEILHFHYLYRNSYSKTQWYAIKKITFSICIYGHQFPNVIRELQKINILSIDRLFKQSSRFKDFLVEGSVSHLFVANPVWTSSLIINPRSCMRFDHFREESRTSRRALGTRKAGSLVGRVVHLFCRGELNRAKNLQEDSFRCRSFYARPEVKSFLITSYDDSFNNDENSRGSLMKVRTFFLVIKYCLRSFYKWLCGE